MVRSIRQQTSEEEEAKSRREMDAHSRLNQLSSVDGHLVNLGRVELWIGYGWFGVRNEERKKKRTFNITKDTDILHGYELHRARQYVYTRSLE